MCLHLPRSCEGPKMTQSHQQMAGLTPPPPNPPPKKHSQSMFCPTCWHYSYTRKMSKQKHELRILFSKAWLTWFSIRILLAPATTWSWCEARNITKFHSWPQPLWSWRYAMFMPDIQDARPCLQHQQDKMLVGVVYSQSWWLLLAKLQQLNI